MEKVSSNSAQGDGGSSPEAVLQQLQAKYRSLSQVMKKVADFPGQVRYKNVLVPETGVSFQYATLIHTNEFKILDEVEEQSCKSIEDIQKMLQRKELLSYKQAGEKLQIRQHSLVKKIVDHQKRHKLPISKFENGPSSSSLEAKVDVESTSIVKQTPRTEPTLQEPQSNTSTAIVTNNTKHSQPKPQVFEIREYISENGNKTGHEVVDISKQLEYMEQLAAENSEGVAFNVSYPLFQ